MLDPLPRRVLLALVLTPLLVLCLPHYRHKLLVYVIDEIPSLYSLYHQGSQTQVGTGLSFPNPENLFVALSTPKFNDHNNSRVYLIGSGSGGSYRVVGQTPLLPKEADPLGVAVFHNELLIVNHQDRSKAVMIYDLGAAFSGELKEIGRIPNLPSPTSILVHDNRLYVTCFGKHSMRGQGIYVYEKDATGAWKQVRRFLYRDLFGRKALQQDYSRWPDLGPISMTVERDIAYISNIHSGSVTTLDLRQLPENAVLGRLVGPPSRIHYPLGVVTYHDRLYVAEHIHNYVAEYSLGYVGKDTAPVRVFSEPNAEMQPFGLLAKDGNILAASISPAQIYVFPISANATTEPSAIMLPDGATITVMARVADARP